MGQEKKEHNDMPSPVVLNTEIRLTGNIDDYPGGIIIPIDKPYRWTSADVIRKVKYAAVRHFGKKNLKVGHAGTLDPLATGVLLVCIGNATKRAEELQNHDKEYIAGVAFGATTPSYDLEKDIDTHYPYGHITEDGVRNALKGFLGEQEQIAPLFSAKSIDGVRAYELARKLYRQQGHVSDAEGIIKASKIRISDIELLKFHPNGKPGDTDISGTAGAYSTRVISESDTDKQASGGSPDSPCNGRTPNLRINVADTSGLNLPTAEIRIECSKGTYIRAFARDLAEALESGGHLCSLIRSRSGDFRVEDCLPIDEAVNIFKQTTT